jgi:outer membrane protein TolC
MRRVLPHWIDTGRTGTGALPVLVAALVFSGILLPEAHAQESERELARSASPEPQASPTEMASPDASPAFTLEGVVATTLAEGAAIRSGHQEVRAARGGLRAASGAFDVTLNASLSSGIENTLFRQSQREQLGISKANQSRAGYDVGVSKQFAFGLIVEPRVSLSRVDAVTRSRAPVVRKETALSLRYPLLRGREKSRAAAQVDAARHSVEASRLSMRNAMATSLQKAAYAYWEYRAAYRRVQVIRRSEERARRLRTDTKKLVEAGEQPQSTLSSLNANVADMVAKRTDTEQQLREARRQLGLAMGLRSEQIGSLPNPSASFPTVDDTLDLPVQERLLAAVSEQRTDLESARLRTEAARELLNAERSAARPRLDLQADVGYAALSDGAGLTAFQHAPSVGQSDVGGPTASLSVSYTLPFGNNEARGRLAQQKATYQQRQIEANQLRRNARSGVVIALNMAKSSRTSVEMARQAVTFYRTAVEDERKKLRHGMSTLLDVTTMQNRLTSALTSLIASKTRYAKALVRLRYETGTLLLPGTRKRIMDRSAAQARRIYTPLSAE